MRTQGYLTVMYTFYCYDSFIEWKRDSQTKRVSFQELSRNWTTSRPFISHRTNKIQIFNKQTNLFEAWTNHNLQLRRNTYNQAHYRKLCNKRRDFHTKKVPSVKSIDGKYLRDCNAKLFWRLCAPQSHIVQSKPIKHIFSPWKQSRHVYRQNQTLRKFRCENTTIAMLN